MKKVILGVTLLCFTLFLLNSGFAAGPVKPKSPATPVAATPQQTAPAATQKPNVPADVKKIRHAQLTNLIIGTDAAGTWFWKATVKNDGTADLKGSDLTVQGTCISFPPAQNTWKAASGSIVSQGTLTPNQSKDVQNFWSRCCLTDQLKVELRDKVTNKVWDTKLLTGLIYSTAPMKPLDVRVKRIEWNAGTKAWQATIKNNTGFTVKVRVQGVLLPGGSGNPVAAGGQQLTLGPQAETKTMQLNVANAKNGDLLRVHIGFIPSTTDCNETWENCGGQGSNNITIPNSADF